MSNDKVIDLSDFITTDPGDEQGEDADVLVLPADDEGGTIEVSIEEILAGFAQGLEILRLGIIETYERVQALEARVYAEDTEIDAPEFDEAAEAELAE